MDGIRHDLLSEADSLRERFAGARPFPYVAIDGLLEPDLLRSLQEQFPAFDPDQARNELGEPGRKAVYQNLASIGPA